VDNAALQGLLTAALEAQLGDRETAGITARRIVEVALSWSPPSAPMARLDGIIAYAFGNRLRPEAATSVDAPLDDRLADPGPVNAGLADVVAALHRQRPVRIYAQWEIARVLRDRHGLPDVVSIEPEIGPEGQIIYLSTDGVARAAAAIDRARPDPAAALAVVAHHDHARRCVQITRAAGFEAFVAADIPLPADYDPLSGQTWTRRRDIYLLHDMLAQLMALRAEAIAQAWPEG
jgi:hypothetical protein